MTKYETIQTGEKTYRITIEFDSADNFLIPIEGGNFKINGTVYVVERVLNVAPLVYDVIVR